MQAEWDTCGIHPQVRGSLPLKLLFYKHPKSEIRQSVATSPGCLISYHRGASQKAKGHRGERQRKRNDSKK